MSRKANATLIGIFVFGAGLLSIAALVFFGSYKIFSESETFVLYFDESVNGLDVGAPVKWKGVPIGRVSEILIRWNQDELSDHVPVMIEIDVTNLVKQLGVSIDLREDAVYSSQINLGLRAQLQMDSLITGMLFIELDYVDDLSSPAFVQQDVILKEIPTIPSPLAEIGESATDIIARISTIDIKSINDELVSLLQRLNESIKDIEFKKINTSILEAVDSFRSLAESEQLIRSLEQFRETMQAYRLLAVNVGGKVDTGMEEVLKSLDEFQTAMKDFQATNKKLQAFMEPDTTLWYEMEETLHGISEAAEEIRDLADYLERNPRSLLTGKADESINPQ